MKDLLVPSLQKINTIDSRTFCFVTCDLDKFFELSSKKEHRKNIVFVDRRDEVKADPSSDALKGTTTFYEMSGYDSAQQSVPRQYDISLR